jgi:iron complex outermembrane receptor protein
MRLNSKELSKAVRYALYAGASAAVGLTAAPVFAQSEEAGSEKLETIVVTGSRIRRADIETAQPVFVIDRKAIENQGFTSVADILQNLTSSGSPAISRSQVLASGENVGGYYVDLRNLGANRTLVLVDGKRLGATSGGYQDLGQIPTSAIERIEVLKDGASSVYGSDAIAGVVNVITRTRFNGAEGSAYVGQFDQDDGNRSVYDFTIGSTSDRSSVTMSVQYSKEEPVWARDREFSAYGNAGPAYPGSGSSAVSQNGSAYLPCGPNGAYTWCTLISGANPGLVTSYRPHVAADNANSNEQMMVQTGVERRSLFVGGTYDITDNIKFRADGLYNSRLTEQEVAGYPYQSAAFGTPLSADSVFNPTGEDLEFRRRLWEMPRNTLSKTDTYRITGGFEGYFDIGDHSWNWDVGASLNRNNTNKRGRGDMSLVASELALGPSFINANGVAQCGTPDNPLTLGTNYAAGDCMPWNPLLPFGVSGPGSLADPTTQDFLFPIFTDTGLTRSTSYTANIAGTLFSLPAGDLGIAAGYEHRIESGVFTPDAFAQTGLYSGLAASTTNGKYALDEFYVELDIPLLKDLPFAKQLSINVASRYSDYDTFGDTVNNKFGLQWRPMDDLLVRGTYAEGFRAPSIDNMFGGSGSSFEYYTDPCSVGVPGSVAGSAACLASGAPANYVQLGQGYVPCTGWPCQTPDPFISGSNPNLTPESSKSKTLGFVYSPSYIEGLDINLDWWKIKIDNVISGDEVDDILKDCFVYGVSSRCTDAGLTRAADGHITMMNYGLANKGFVETEGYDLSVNYRLPEFSFGRFMVRWDTTYTSVYDTKADNAPDTAVLGNVGYWVTPRVRSNLSLDWDLGSFGATWTTRYYSGAKESCIANRPCDLPGHIDSEGNSDPLRTTGSNAFHDIQLRWTAPWDGTFSVGANNVGEHYAAIAFTAPASQYPYYGGFDIGRFYYAKYTQRF